MNDPKYHGTFGSDLKNQGHPLFTSEVLWETVSKIHNSGVASTPPRNTHEIHANPKTFFLEGGGEEGLGGGVDVWLNRDHNLYNVIGLSSNEIKILARGI